MTLPITALLIEDEENARTLFKSMLREIAPHIQVIGEAISVSEGIRKIKKAKPQLLFLDVELADGTAFDLLRQIQNLQSQIIFITAYNHYALEAIRFAAIDYLLKPLNLTDLRRAVSRVKPLQENRSVVAQMKVLLDNFQTPKESRKMAIPTKEKIYFVEVDQIIRCESGGNYTWIYLKNGKKILSTHLLKEYEMMLGEESFFRIHHKHLINLDYIREYTRGEGGVVTLSNGERVEVSRRKKTAFLAVLASLA